MLNLKDSLIRIGMNQENQKEYRGLRKSYSAQNSRPNESVQIPMSVLNAFARYLISEQKSLPLVTLFVVVYQFKWTFSTIYADCTTSHIKNRDHLVAEFITLLDKSVANLHFVDVCTNIQLILFILWYVTCQSSQLYSLFIKSNLVFQRLIKLFFTLVLQLF